MKKTNLFQIGLAILYMSALAVFLYFLVTGAGYYLTPIDQRPYHESFRALKPAGTLGLRFGIAGALVMWLLLLYSVRKRTRLFGNSFRLKHWLDVHIWCGIMGPLFILLHTSFKLGGLVAISFWSMIAVACSGIFGRYLYIQIPRNIRGDELSIVELEREDEALGERLESEFGLERAALDEIMAVVADDNEGANTRLWAMIVGDLRRWRRWRRARSLLTHRFSIPSAGVNALLAIARRKATLKRRIARLALVHRFFHYWHVVHRPFALIMYIIMLVHIVVALLFGISWRSL